MMHWLAVSVAAAALFGSAFSQSDNTPNYVDKQGRNFSAYATDAGITYGISIPTNVTAAPFDIIVQITAPISVGWAGLAWGGAMTYNPLTIVWPNGNETVISSRMAFGYFVPQPFDGATYRLLPGSGVNATHFFVTAVCKGCSSWSTDEDSDPTVLDPTGQNYLAFAYSDTPVATPADNTSSFNIHDRAGHWVHDFSLAADPKFNVWETAEYGSNSN